MYVDNHESSLAYMSSDVGESYYIIKVDVYLSPEQMSNSSEVLEWLDFMQETSNPCIFYACHCCNSLSLGRTTNLGCR